MRTKVQFTSIEGKPIVLPLQYLYSIHQLVYKMFTPDIARKLYLDGFLYKGRKLKLFNYSRILEHGKVNKALNTINFDSTISFYFSCSLSYLVDDFIKNAFTTENIKLNDNNLMLSMCEIVEAPLFSDKMEITMLSPMTVYSTFQRKDKKVTHYYMPIEPTFSELVEENAKKKYATTMIALGTPVSEQTLSQMHLELIPKRYNPKYNKKVLYFKNKVVEGYTGDYTLVGSPELIAITYDCGLGASTAVGFGMWSPLLKKEAVG